MAPPPQAGSHCAAEQAPPRVELTPRPSASQPSAPVGQTATHAGMHLDIWRRPAIGRPANRSGSSGGGPSRIPHRAVALFQRAQQYVEHGELWVVFYKSCPQ